MKKITRNLPMYKVLARVYDKKKESALDMPMGLMDTLPSERQLSNKVREIDENCTLLDFDYEKLVIKISIPNDLAVKISAIYGGDWNKEELKDKISEVTNYLSVENLGLLSEVVYGEEEQK